MKDFEQNRAVKNGAAKKPYVAPSFEYERVFETMALACGKISSTQLTCHAIRKTS